MLRKWPTASISTTSLCISNPGDGFCGAEMALSLAVRFRTTNAHVLFFHLTLSPITSPISDTHCPEKQAVECGYSVCALHARASRSVKCASHFIVLWC